MARWIYTLLFYLISPLLLIRLWQRGRKAPAYRQRWRERFGWVHAAARPTLWVHAVSVGETVAAAGLVRRLQQAYPQYLIAVTTMTPTGSGRVRALFGDGVWHAYAPYDLPHALARFIRRLQPQVLIIIETELWPNMIHACRQRGIPVILANARLSERSARGYQRVGRMTRPMLAELSWIAAQAQADAQRFIALGVPPERVQVTGSIKFDLTLDEALRSQALQLRQNLGAERPVWIAASTHAGEDEVVLQAHRIILQQHPDALLILVPRHPERFAQVADLILNTGLTLARRSQSGAAVSAQVLLGDTMGELLLLYGGADLAFVGGSLVENGGHNPLEPAAWGLPIIMGPHVFNFADVCQRLSEGEALCYAGSAEVLAARVLGFLKDPGHRKAIGAQALAVMEANRGALAYLLRGCADHIKG